MVLAPAGKTPLSRPPPPPRRVAAARRRWIDMDTDVAVNGAGVGVAHVDPILVGVSAVLRF
ncbi:MAG: hypothetical protein IPF83_01720 [Rhodanobacteraceae bacterium]|nr:hypothetical protein [Rhodanobacteraceae bacterium]